MTCNGIHRGDAVRLPVSVPAGSQPPDRTDSHGHCPRNTLTSTNLKAGPAANTHQPRCGTSAIQLTRGVLGSEVTGSCGPVRGPQDS
jgi:hypothetical protein